MTTLAKHGGKAKIITSPQLSESDWQAIKTGSQAQQDQILRNRLKDQVTDLHQCLSEDTKNALGWLIADGIIKIRFAVPTNRLDGEFHDKWAIFESATGDRVAVHGSQNDSERGFRNYESYDVFADWIDDRETQRVMQHDRRFERLWNDEDDNVSIYSIPDAVYEEIISLRTTTQRPYTLPDMNTPDIELRDYQQEAVDAWKTNGYHGLFRMATGTGKTYTALGAMHEFIEDRTDPLLIVVSVPYTHLATQWEESLEEWGYSRSKHVYGSANRNWKQDLSKAIDDLTIGIRDCEIVLTTHTSMSHDYFIEQTKQAPCEALLIADEVHGLGSENRRKGLHRGYNFRLGLSATPERQYDETGTEYLLEYFGDIIYEFPLKDAIPEYLVPYNYYPVIVELTEEELAIYRNISRKIATEFSKEDPDQELLERLMLKRARMVKAANNKIPQLRRIIRDIAEHERDHLLVYTNPQQFDYVQDVLNEEGIIQHRFTAEEETEERAELLKSFADGRYDALVAMKCLDEGVNVPSTQRAILMSNSNNPMQFVQRRGRVLRRADEFGKDYADIYDIIVVPSLKPDRTLIKSEKGLLRKELRRFEEFAGLAKNAVQARNRIEPLRTQYEL
ncbi:DEAD/DEAH box helicase family protein [Haloprofundus salinisoli]|uniref:DEAD/DEAH box helicase family protein n=1 Tax=Haloprofundus salinisoli TaxID=2876193 RepID=UPI001CCAF541|nr:DEAD/DEAH box helicase family protein [Haloprofundus salinisoli]